MTANNNDKFNKLIAIHPPSKWAKKHLERKIQRTWSMDSFTIALNVLTILEEKGWNKTRLAKELDVSTAYITKVVKGKVNFTLESLAKLSSALGEPLINIELIDREREKRNYEQMIEWLSAVKSIRTTKSTNRFNLTNTRVTSFRSDTREVLHTEYNTMAMANNNLRPTG